MKLLTAFIFIFSFVINIFSQEKGNATYYSHKLSGRKTSDGGRYHPDSLTCAHKTYPLGTYLLVRNPKNDKQVIVKVTDRGPFSKRLTIDLSFSAAKKLDIIQQGVAKVEITQINIPESVFSIIPVPKSYIQVKDILIPNSFWK